MRKLRIWTWLILASLALTGCAGGGPIIEDANFEETAPTETKINTEAEPSEGSTELIDLTYSWREEATEKDGEREEEIVASPDEDEDDEMVWYGEKLGRDTDETAELEPEDNLEEPKVEQSEAVDQNNAPAPETAAPPQESMPAQPRTEEINVAEYRLGEVLLRLPSGYKLLKNLSTAITMQNVTVQKEQEGLSIPVSVLYWNAPVEVYAKSNFSEAASAFFTELFGRDPGVKTGDVFEAPNSYLSVYEASDSQIYMAIKYGSGDVYAIGIPKGLPAAEYANIYPLVGSILNGISEANYDPALDQYAYEWITSADGWFRDFQAGAPSGGIPSGNSSQATASALPRKQVDLSGETVEPVSSLNPSRGKAVSITQVIETTTQRDPAPAGEWIEAKAYSPADNDYHTIYFRVVGITDDGQQIVDEWNNSEKGTKFQEITDPALAYKTLHYEVYYPANFPHADYGISAPQLKFKVTDKDGEGIVYGGSSYVGLSNVWDVTSWRSDDYLNAGEAFEGTAVFAMVDDPSVQYEFSYEYQDSSGSGTSLYQFANAY